MNLRNEKKIKKPHQVSLIPLLFVTAFLDIIKTNELEGFFFPIPSEHPPFTPIKIFTKHGEDEYISGPYSTRQKDC